MGDYSPSTFYTERSIKSVMVSKYSPHCQVTVQYRRHPKYRLHQGKKRTVFFCFLFYNCVVFFMNFWLISWFPPPSLTFLVGSFPCIMTRSENILFLFFFIMFVDIIFSNISFRNEWLLFNAKWTLFSYTILHVLLLIIRW